MRREGQLEGGEGGGARLVAGAVRWGFGWWGFERDG